MDTLSAPDRTAKTALRPLFILNGNVLSPDGFQIRGLALRDGLIGDIKTANDQNPIAIDATGLLVLPGLVDVHGDAFERQIMPRPSVQFDYDLALRDTDRQLAANGITTAFHGLTLSWEPGVRSLGSAKAFMAALGKYRASCAVDHRVQLRWEIFAIDAIDDIKQWFAQNPKPALAFNDHTTSTCGNLARINQRKLSGWARRCGLTEDQYVELATKIYERKDDVDTHVRIVAEAAAENNIVMLSHDDISAADRNSYRDLGSTISEFPMKPAAVENASKHGDHIVFGAPNVVRGGSHNNALNAAEMIAAGRCTLLASDYHYPSMHCAAAKLAMSDQLTLEEAWNLVSTNPANAMNLDDRGSIAPGKRADIVLARQSNHGLEIVATIAGGRLVHLAEGNIIT